MSRGNLGDRRVLVRVAILFCIVVVAAEPTWAQGSFVLSKNSDFSTDDRVFSRSDKLYMRVVTSEVDFTDIEKNRFELESKNRRFEIEGKFKNLLNGTYEASLELSATEPNESDWEWHGRIRDDSGNEFRARVDIRIIDQDSGEEVALSGIIESSEDSILVVAGNAFVLTESTEILDSQDKPIFYSDLVVGQEVEISGIRGNDGIVRATRIKVTDSGLQENEIKVSGTVTEVDASHLVVAGLRFTVDEFTSILDQNDHEVALSVIKSGFVVEITATVLANDTLVATQIRIRELFRDELDITGVIESVGDSVLVVSELEFGLTDSTRILNDDGQTIGYEALQVGMVVEIIAIVELDGTLTAVDIRTNDRFQDEVKLTGTIDAVAFDSLVVSGITFFVDTNTEILDGQGFPIGLVDLRAEQIVEMEASLQTQGRLLATRIRVESRIENEVKITGTIENLAQNSITALGLIFGIADNTVFLDNSDNVIPRSDLRFGLPVEVRGDLLRDGTLIAIRVKAVNRDANELGTVGSIESLAPNMVQVLGVNFVVTDSTQIRDISNTPIAFSDLMLGPTVEVKGLRQADGSRLATRLKIKDVLILSGVISEVVSNGIAVAGKQILFNSDTMILGKENRFLTVAELEVGQFVEVRAEKFHDNSIFATKVEVRGTTLLTTVEPIPSENENVPKEFALLQNYPNPFNPATTIHFEIPQSGNGPINTKLVVYNLLGQVVQTLVERPLNSGAYQIRWNGQDRFGNAAASGIYLYRLEAGKFSQTRRMTLLK